MVRKLLVLDTSYGFETIEERKLHDSVTCRDLGGYFEHVWTVHPFASLVASDRTPKFGAPAVHEVAPGHTFIDGKIGRFGISGRLWPVDFAASQIDIITRLSALVRRERINAIRTNDPLYTGLLGLVLARAFRIPLVVRVNGNYDKIFAATGRPMMPRFFRSYAVEKRVVRYVLRRADLVAAVNQDNLDYAIENGARPNASTIFRYGNLIDKRHVAPPDERDRSGEVLRELWPEKFRFLLHVGRLESVKFPEDPIRVLAELRRRGHDIKLLLVGDGSQREALSALARELGVDDHVAFCGSRDQEWLAKVIPLASAVLSPLTGRALSEAAFGSAPIVAYDLDWQGELVRSGETGELVPSRDWQRMADSTERFLVDLPYARAMGAAVRKRAFEMLDPATLDEHERQQYTAMFERFSGGRTTPR